MFADVTTAEVLARHRAAELEHRIDLAHHQAERPRAARPAATPGGRAPLLRAFHLARSPHAAAR